MQPWCRVEFLGTGTSTGVPEIACSCSVCQSEDPRDKRHRSSIYIKSQNSAIVIDTTPEFRIQALRAGMDRLNSVILTHLHADHFFGLDDVRRFNHLKQDKLNLYLPQYMQQQFRNCFGYTLKEAPKGLSWAAFNLHLIDLNSWQDGDFIVTPLPIFHGSEEIRGYKFEFYGRKFAYITDAKHIPEATIELIKDCDFIIINALWQNRRKHINHFDLEEVMGFIKHIGIKKAYLTHSSHHIGKYCDLVDKLPKWVVPAYDGLQINITGDENE